MHSSSGKVLSTLCCNSLFHGSVEIQLLPRVPRWLQMEIPASESARLSIRSEQAVAACQMQHVSMDPASGQMFSGWSQFSEINYTSHFWLKSLSTDIRIIKVHHTTSDAIFSTESLVASKLSSNYYRLGIRIWACSSHSSSSIYWLARGSWSGRCVSIIIYYLSFDLTTFVCHSHIRNISVVHSVVADV